MNDLDRILNDSPPVPLDAPANMENLVALGRHLICTQQYRKDFCAGMIRDCLGPFGVKKVSLCPEDKIPLLFEMFRKFDAGSPIIPPPPTTEEVLEASRDECEKLEKLCAFYFAHLSAAVVFAAKAHGKGEKIDPVELCEILKNCPHIDTLPIGVVALGTTIRKDLYNL